MDLAGRMINEIDGIDFGSEESPRCVSSGQILEVVFLVECWRGKLMKATNLAWRMRQLRSSLATVFRRKLMRQAADELAAVSGDPRVAEPLFGPTPVRGSLLTDPEGHRSREGQWQLLSGYSPTSSRRPGVAWEIQAAAVKTWVDSASWKGDCFHGWSAETEWSAYDPASHRHCVEPYCLFLFSSVEDNYRFCFVAWW